MIIFDFLLLTGVSVLLGLKSLYLGTVTLVIGLLIGFQSVRMKFLLGEKVQVIPAARRVKSAVLALTLTACMYPFVIETGTVPGFFEKDFNSNSVLPIIIVIGFFSATLMAALAVEKRKR